MTSPGIYPSMARADYDAIKALNMSVLLRLRQSPAHAHAEQEPATDPQRFGTVLHCYLLEPERFKSYYAVRPKVVRNETHAKYKAYLDEVGGDGARIIWPEEVAKLAMIRLALFKSARRRAYTQTPGKYEVVIVWKDERTGVLCKGMLDKLIESINRVLDLKKCGESALPRDFFKAVATYGYHIRAAWYMDGLLALTGKKHSYAFLAVEDYAPYESATYLIRPDDETYRIGRWEYRNLLATYAQCVRTGNWPGYYEPAEPDPVILPKWAVPQNMLDGD